MYYYSINLYLTLYLYTFVYNCIDHILRFTMQGVMKSHPMVTTPTVVVVVTVAVETRVVVHTGTTVDPHYWRRRLPILQSW